MQVPGVGDAELAGRRVLVRVDFNVPVQDGRVMDDRRIRAVLPTLRHLVGQGARVVLVSHLGRPKGVPDPAASLRPVAGRLGEVLGSPVAFCPETVGPAARAAVEALEPGHVLILENVRFHPGETSNDPALAEALAGLADAFVNDAFGTAHRAHASTVGVAQHLPCYAGLLMRRELEVLGDLLEAPARPFTAVLGGAKVSDKVPVLRRLVERVDRLVVGGGMAFTFLAAQGVGVGRSRVEEGLLDEARDILAQAASAGVEVLLPEDVEEADAFDARAHHRAVRLDRMDPEWMGLDIGPLAARRFASAVRTSATVLWNGPMGVFEWPAFAFGTRAVAQAVAACPGTTVVGGGDTAAAARAFGVEDRVTHISTGGGATLEFLEGRVLPGVAALAGPVAEQAR